MNVLICTTSTARDPGVPMVIDALAARGAEAIRLESDRFPGEIDLSIHWDREDRVLLSSSAGAIDLGRIAAAWIRHTDTGEALPVTMDRGHREAARNESDAMLWGLLECLDVYRLDPPEALRAAPYKPRQLQLARQHGLAIPKTLVTNSPEAARDFARTCPGGVVAKLVDGSTLRVDASHDAARVFTRRLDDDDLAHLEGLRLAPMIFQELVPKARELRVTVVGARAFVAAVDAGKSELGAADWRRDRALAATFVPWPDCPPAVLDRLMALLTRLGLDFATIDMIVTPDGRHVFLELNTISYFDFIERATGQPISLAIADLLLGLGPSRFPHRRTRA